MKNVDKWPNEPLEFNKIEQLENLIVYLTQFKGKVLT